MKIKKNFRTGFKNGYKLAKVHNIQDLNKAKSILHYVRRPQRKAVKKILSINQTDYIVGLVCDKYQVKHDLIYGKCRLEFICMVRSIIINLIYDLFEISTPELGRRFNRDHSTILHHTRLKMNKKGIGEKVTMQSMKIMKSLKKSPKNRQWLLWNIYHSILAILLALL